MFNVRCSLVLDAYTEDALGLATKQHRFLRQPRDFGIIFCSDEFFAHHPAAAAGQHIGQLQITAHVGGIDSAGRDEFDPA